MIGIMFMLAIILFALLGISDDLIRIANAIERLSKEKKNEGSEADAEKL